MSITSMDTKLNTEANKALNDTLVRLTRGDVFFATLAFYLQPKFTDKPWLLTAGTNGTRLLLNQQFFMGLTSQEQVALLKHEVLHVAFEHPFRRGKRNLKRWNIACDYVINLLIKEEGGTLPPGGLYDETYKGLIEEEVYEKLPKNIEKSFSFFMDDLLEEDKPGSRTALRDKARTLVLQASQATRMTQGSLPFSVGRYLDAILQPEQDWRALLAEYLTAQGKSDYDWMRPNRRNSVLGNVLNLNIFLPGIQQSGALEHVAIVVDTSGSIGREELARFIGEILGIVEVCYPRTLTIIPCDAMVYPPLVFDRVPQSTEVMAQLQSGSALQGGGGTSMPVALDWIDNGITRQAFDVPPAVVLVMTDGYTDFGNARNYPVIWCITSPESAVPDPWGRVVRIA
ncbi:hydrolase [Betaproteobacteria bacterium]|nr:hydrolase [Betaproteobacteria bacterium]